MSLSPGPPAFQVNSCSPVPLPFFHTATACLELPDTILFPDFLAVSLAVANPEQGKFLFSTGVRWVFSTAGSFSAVKEIHGRNCLTLFNGWFYWPSVRVLSLFLSLGS